MNLRKLIKYYFVFLMLAVSTVSMQQSETVNNYYANVLIAFERIKGDLATGNDWMGEKLISPVKAEVLESVPDAFLRDFTPSIYSREAVSFVLNVANDGKFIFDTAMVFESAKIALKAEESDLEFNYLKLSLEGISMEKVKSIALFEDNSEKTFVGEFFENAFVFTDMGIKINKGENKIIKLKIEFKEQLKSGDRFRLKIDSYEDIGLTKSQKAQTVSGFYPIQSEYVNVVKVRLPTNNKAKKK